MKIDSNYQPEWCLIYGGNNNDYLQEVLSINDSIVAIGGYSFSNTNNLAPCDSFPSSYAYSHAWYGIVNINTRQLIWQKALCGSGNDGFAGFYYDTASNVLYVLVNGGSTDGDFAGTAVNDSGAMYLLKYTMDTATGIDAMSTNSNNLDLYPNPATGYFIAKYQNYQPGMSLAVCNCLGQAIQQQPLRGANQQIDVSHLIAGLYIVCVKQDNEVVASGKFVKE